MFPLILGLVISALVITSALSTRRAPLLIFSIGASLCSIVLFITLGAMVGAGSSIINVIRNSALLTSLKVKKLSWMGHWSLTPVFVVGHIIMFTFMNDWSEFIIWNFAPLAAAIISVIALGMKNILVTKSMMLSVILIWIAYEFYTGAYGMMLGDAVNFVATIVAIVLIVKTNNKIDLTHEIGTAILSTVTKAIQVIDTEIKTKLLTVPTTGIETMKEKAEESIPSPTSAENVEEAETEIIYEWNDLPSAGTEQITHLPRA